MTVFNLTLAFLSAGMLFLAFFTYSSLIFIHKKINSKHFYFATGALLSSFYIFFELLLGLSLTEPQYLLFHKLKMISAIMSFPIFFISFYNIYAPNGNKKVVYSIAYMMPVYVIAAFFNFFLSYPIKHIVVQTPITNFVYNVSTPGPFYIAFILHALFSLIVGMVQYFKSGSSSKRWEFLFIIIVMIICALNDSLVSRGVIKNIMLLEFGFFAVLILVFFDLLRDDRKTYEMNYALNQEILAHRDKLEETVGIRTQQLKKEQQKSESLLLNVLPEAIANRLKNGERTIVDSFSNVSVIFVDIVGFTELASRANPRQIVALLNDIFTSFDRIADKHGLEKIKTIGDAYMAAAGIPEPQADHAERTILFAGEIKNEMNNFKFLDDTAIDFRIGIDCGSVVAGIIGEKKFIYDLWSDTVNTASRMESTGVPGKIQVTENFKNALEVCNGKWSFVPREAFQVKGKGIMNTYFIE